MGKGQQLPNLASVNAIDIQLTQQFQRTPESPLGGVFLCMIFIIWTFSWIMTYTSKKKRFFLFFFFEISVVKSVLLVLWLFIIIFRYSALHYLDGGEIRNINLPQAKNV